MNFWILAIALLVIPAVIISWPLISGSIADRITGLFIVLMIPLAGILMYQTIGTPEAINLPSATVAQQATQQQPHADEQGQMDDLVTALQQRMAENPDDAEGWLILGRSLKTMQRYTEALTALVNANRLMPDNPMLMIELAETQLFASGQAQIGPESLQLIESALQIDPQQQKGLWLMGMASAQDGDYANAIAYWQTLQGQLDPTSGAASTVNQQIAMARKEMGESPAALPADHPAIDTTANAETAASAETTDTPEPAVTTTVAESGIPVTISIADEIGATLQGNGILFVFIHPSGAKGMPLAVKRLPASGFPINLNFTDADLLQPGGSLQSFEKLDISARISMTGGVVPTSGDIQANLVTLDTQSVSNITLSLNQRVP